ncbi:MAG TPA: tRNA lysidine(34) synthetase TilS [Thermoanaerobaculia bacterium]|jgi:tRNA(Ile)-lysidine synthase|nr:tRNA lysidine(34) synthetase TilS [Thermoanaerobaculia bacterium]
MLLANIRQFFVKRGISPCRIVAAVSGGIDSTALLLGLWDLRADGFEIVAAHLNHHLRGADSDADEAFVRDLCKHLGVELRVADGTLDPERVRERGIEAAAREVRYTLLTSIREETGARFVATAHQKNDQAETVLMRILTGSGIAGLRGIHPVREDGYVRPLLEVARAEIESFLRERNVVARVDRSNEDPRFLRNRVRVFLREVDATETLVDFAAQAQAMWPILERSIDAAERAHAEVRDGETRFTSWPDDPWLRGALLQRHIRRLDPHARDFDASRLASEVDAIRRVSVTKNLELVRDGSACVLKCGQDARTPIENFEVELTEKSPAHLPALGITMHLAELHGQRATGNGQLLQLPENARATFTVRNRRNGDRFHPLGLPQPKKLKDFLIDRKIAAELRDRLPLLVWNGEIVWIAGVEVSERFKVTDAVGVLFEVWLDDSRDHSGLQR